MTVSRLSIIAERLRRQGLVEPLEAPEEYELLFRLLQPIAPPPDSCPGEPPSLAHRTSFDDRDVTNNWRETREIVKGRFLGGRVGYVFSDELELYANAFQRPLEKLNRNHELVFDTLAHVGPLTPRQLKEETGLLNKEIMPILHRLQEAFIVYEDQLDSDWERPWYVFSQEWPNLVIEPERWKAAAQEVLQRFISSLVFVTSEQVKEWSCWSVKEAKHLLQLMQANGTIVPCSIDGLGEGWIMAEDMSLNTPMPPPATFMLHSKDPILRACMSELKQRYSGLEVQRYLMIDGEVQGVVCAHWRINPFDIDDIIVDLPVAKRTARKDEIIEAVSWEYHPPRHHILRYQGEPLT